jgi:tetratricopeptide (TPR) repeat protein
MGAFLYRFPTTEIRFGYFLWIRFLKFSIPAYAVIPLWLGMQLLSGVMARVLGTEGGVAYWEHIGGFAFGVLGAYLLRTTGIEHVADSAVEAKVSWTADPHLVRAGESLEANRPDLAIADLQQLIAQDPNSIDAWDLLLKAQTRAQDFTGQRESLATLCRLRVLAGEMEAAAFDYDSLKNLGDAKLHRSTWLELCRYYERSQHWQTAADEYEKLGQAYPTHRVGVSATVSAAEINFARLNRVDRAEKLLRRAQLSSAPHADLDAKIVQGLARCAAAQPAVVPESSYDR